MPTTKVSNVKLDDSMEQKLSEFRENETQRQQFFIGKMKAFVEEKLKNELGHAPTCCVTTFGCQMNARDSEKLVGILEQIGYVIVEDEKADFVI